MQHSNTKIIEKIELAKDYLEKRQDNRAYEILNQIIKEKPFESEIWLYLGIAKRRLGNLHGATECFKNAGKIDHSLIEAWGLLTITLLDQGKINLAKEALDEALKLNPENEKIQFFQDNLINVYTKFGPFF